MEGVMQFVERVGVAAAFAILLLGLLFWFLRQIMPLIKEWFAVNIGHYRASAAAIAAHTKIAEEQKNALHKLATLYSAGEDIIDMMEILLCPKDLEKVRVHLERAKATLRASAHKDT